MDKTWAVQDAKARFSEVLRAAEKEPQHITYRGEEKAVLISAEDFRRLQEKSKDKPAMTFYELWKSAPKVPEFKLPPRRREAMRKVKF